MDINETISVMKEIKNDETVPKNVKEKLDECITILEGNDEKSMKITKVLHELEEVTTDANLQQYSRAQLFNIISELESLLD